MRSSRVTMTQKAKTQKQSSPIAMTFPNKISTAPGTTTPKESNARSWFTPTQAKDPKDPIGTQDRGVRGAMPFARHNACDGIRGTYFSELLASRHSFF